MCVPPRAGSCSRMHAERHSPAGAILGSKGAIAIQSAIAHALWQRCRVSASGWDSGATPQPVPRSMPTLSSCLCSCSSTCLALAATVGLAAGAVALGGAVTVAVTVSSPVGGAPAGGGFGRGRWDCTTVTCKSGAGVRRSASGQEAAGSDKAAAASAGPAGKARTGS